MWVKKLCQKIVWSKLEQHKNADVLLRPMQILVVLFLYHWVHPCLAWKKSSANSTDTTIKENQRQMSHNVSHWKGMFDEVDVILSFGVFQGVSHRSQMDMKPSLWLGINFFMAKNARIRCCSMLRPSWIVALKGCFWCHATSCQWCAAMTPWLYAGREQKDPFCYFFEIKIQTFPRRFLHAVHEWPRILLDFLCVGLYPESPQHFQAWNLLGGHGRREECVTSNMRSKVFQRFFWRGRWAWRSERGRVGDVWSGRPTLVIPWIAVIPWSQSFFNLDLHSFALLVQVPEGQGSYKQVVKYYHVGEGRGDFEPASPSSSPSSFGFWPMAILLGVLILCVPLLQDSLDGPVSFVMFGHDSYLGCPYILWYFDTFCGFCWGPFAIPVGWSSQGAIVTRWKQFCWTQYCPLHQAHDTSSGLFVDCDEQFAAGAGVDCTSVILERIPGYGTKITL